MIPIAVALFYCKLSSSITSKFSWITSPTFKFKYENLSIFIHRLFLFLFSSVSFNHSKSYDHTHSPISSRKHLDPCHIYQNLSCLAHIYSNYNCVILSTVWFISIIDSTLLMWCCYNQYHSTCSYSMLFNESLNHILKYHPFISNPLLTQSCSLVLKYSICKWVNWVNQYFMNPCPMPRCNKCDLRIIVVTIIQ
jgi:hypothetical protein